MPNETGSERPTHNSTNSERSELTPESAKNIGTTIVPSIPSADRSGFLILPLAAAIGLFSFTGLVGGQTPTPDRVIVTDQGVLSAYGAPAAFSDSRFGSLTNAYVLPEGVVYSSLIYEAQALRFSHPAHLFTQEIEIGLPYRFNVAIENSVETFSDHTQERTFSFEVRYALADWNKIPLNPTIFVEYKKGIGRVLHNEGKPMRPDPNAGEAERPPHIPDAGEVRLLLSQDFDHKIEWALNLFFEQELTGDRGREWGFAQSILRPVLLPREQLKVGIEMQYSNFTDKDTRHAAAQRFVIGPTIAWKPSRNTSLYVSPLVGVTYDAPRVQVFAVFAATFGPRGTGREAHESEAPASTRNR